MSETPAVSAAPGKHLPIGCERQVVMAVRVSCQLHRLPGAQAVDERGSLWKTKQAGISTAADARTLKQF